MSNGNLTATSTISGFGAVRSVGSQTTGKYYFELTPSTLNQTTTGFGIANSSAVLSTVNSSLGVNACFVTFSGNIFFNGANSGINVGTITFGASGRVCFALDMTNKLLWIRGGPTNQWNSGGTANPATGVGGLNISAIASTGIYALFDPFQAGEVCIANFGDTAFSGTVPSGFTAGFPAAPTTANVTQAFAEHWLTTDPAAQVTQVVAEHWASVASGNLQAVVTQVMLEHWASVAVVVPAAGGPMVTMIH